MGALLSQAKIRAALNTIPGWTFKDDAIHRLYAFPDFPSALLFVNYVGYLAQKADHHPDIDIRYRKVLLTLSTHSDGGLTAKDVSLARRIDHAG